MKRRSAVAVGWLCASIVACAGASGSDGPLPTKSDGHPDVDDSGSSFVDTSVDDTGGAADSASTVDTAIDTPIDETTDASLVCALDEYDVDGDPSNGCEVKEPGTGHDFSAPFSFGNVSECDTGTGGGYGWVKHDDVFASDLRKHGPALDDGRLGRPDYILAVHRASTFCRNDPTWQLTMTGGTGTYRVTLYRHGTKSEIDTKCSPQTVGGSETTIQFLCTGQDDGEKAIFEIEKMSGPSEVVRYTFQYHN